MDCLIPKHVAIIPDGNRRWATGKGLVATLGHEKSASYENIISLFDESKRLKIDYLSLWGFSTDNWKRSRIERDTIFGLVSNLAKKMRKEAYSNETRFRLFGRRERLPSYLVKDLESLEDETKKYSDFNVQFCLDYDGNDEIVRAVNKGIKEGVRIFDEKTIEKYLDTVEIPDPDLIIRSSGEQRLSGFMSWQIKYSELYFSKKNFPDFRAEDLKEAVEDFSKRKRRFGGN